MGSRSVIGASHNLPRQSCRWSGEVWKVGFNCWKFHLRIGEDVQFDNLIIQCFLDWLRPFIQESNYIPSLSLSLQSWKWSIVLINPPSRWVPRSGQSGCLEDPVIFHLPCLLRVGGVDPQWHDVVPMVWNECQAGSCWYFLDEKTRKASMWLVRWCAVAWNIFVYVSTNRDILAGTVFDFGECFPIMAMPLGETSEAAGQWEILRCSGSPTWQVRRIWSTQLQIWWNVPQLMWNANRDNFCFCLSRKPWSCRSCLKGILCFPDAYSWNEIQQTFNMKQSCKCSFDKVWILICSFSAIYIYILTLFFLSALRWWYSFWFQNTTLSPPMPVQPSMGPWLSLRSYGVSRKITKDSDGVAALEEISACNPLPGGVCFWVWLLFWRWGRLRESGSLNQRKGWLEVKVGMWAKGDGSCGKFRENQKWYPFWKGKVYGKTSMFSYSDPKTRRDSRFEKERFTRTWKNLLEKEDIYVLRIHSIYQTSIFGLMCQQHHLTRDENLFWSGGLQGESRLNSSKIEPYPRCDECMECFPTFGLNLWSISRSNPWHMEIRAASEVWIPTDFPHRSEHFIHQSQRKLLVIGKKEPTQKPFFCFFLHQLMEGIFEYLYWKRPRFLESEIPSSSVWTLTLHFFFFWCFWPLRGEV